MFFHSMIMRFFPWLIAGSYREDKNTTKTVESAIGLIAWTPFNAVQVQEFIQLVLKTNTKNMQWQTRKTLLRFLLIFVGRNCEFMVGEAREMLLGYLVEKVMRDKQLEVRIQARGVLSALIQSTTLKKPLEIEKLSVIFERLARVKIPKRNFNLSVEESAAEIANFKRKRNLKLRKKHCGILGLSSLVLSFPYTCPEWMPKVLSFLANFDGERVPIGNTVKKTISEFKRTHLDQWHIFQKQFTVEQLEDIQDANSVHSYFV